MHIDALRLSPQAYLTAVKWWVLRKKVRARGQFAPLLSQSPKAYELWTTLEEPGSTPAFPTKQFDNPIVALVLDRGNAKELEASINSLESAGLRAVVIPGIANQTLHKSTAAIDWKDPQWVMPIIAGDTVAFGSAAAYCGEITKAGASLSVIYADDDQLDRWGHRTKPYFKPDWNTDLYRQHDYLTGACIVRCNQEALAAASLTPDWASALVARALADGAGAAHIPKVLHHRNTRRAPPLSLPKLTVAASLPRVSVIIPTRNGTDLLRTCITGLRTTLYPKLEIIVADNDSNDPGTLAYLQQLAGQGIIVLPQPAPFNYSAINNRAVEVASGDLICLLNNDIEMLSSDWLSIMASQAMRPDIGAVGAQLLYPDGRIQHAGVVIGVGNAAGHAHRFIRPDDEGYFRRHALPQFVSAVTAACLVVKKERFLAVGGLDETSFPVAFNDVDLCLRLNQRGWQSFYEPRAVLVHHESISRGHDLDPVGAARFARELAALQRIWRTDEIVDPYHHPHLSRASEQFTMALL